jgi:hypothetical protein
MGGFGMNLVLIGGGNASATLMKYFSGIEYIKILGIADIDDQAPGIIEAKKMGIPVFSDFKTMMADARVDTCIELTGNERVRHSVLEMLKPHQHFMSSNGAKIMVDYIRTQNSQREEIVERLSAEFSHLTSRLKSSEEYIEDSVLNIESVLKSMHIVTMNARIEAARAGDSGKAFEVVVQAMQGTLKGIEKALKQIAAASDESKNTMLALLDTESKLKHSLVEG